MTMASMWVSRNSNGSGGKCRATCMRMSVRKTCNLCFSMYSKISSFVGSLPSCSGVAARSRPNRSYRLHVLGANFGEASLLVDNKGRRCGARSPEKRRAEPRWPRNARLWKHKSLPPTPLAAAKPAAHVLGNAHTSTAASPATANGTRASDARPHPSSAALRPFPVGLARPS